MTEVKSFIKYLRISPKKIKSLAALTVGLSIEEALNRLEVTTGKAARHLSSVIKTAKSDAVNNYKLNLNRLYIKEVAVMKGPFFKRWQPVARGMAHSIKKRTSHLVVKLSEREIKKAEDKILPVEKGNK